MEYMDLLKYKEEYENAYNEIIKKDFEVADKYKAWDMVHILNAVKELNLPKTARIVNLGAYNDATLWALNQSGYRNLYGIDLNEDIYNTRFYTQIRYQYGNIEDTHFPSNFFDGALSLSVIEHNVDLEKFLKELARILKVNSPLLITADFSIKKTHPHSPDKVFSYEEILRFIGMAESHGFVPLFEKKKLKGFKKYDSYRPVHWSGVDYNFIFLGFRLAKKDRQTNPIPRGVSVISYSKGKNGGINRYATTLAKRLKKEYKINAEIVDTTKEAKYNTVVIEEQALCSDQKLKEEVSYLRSKGSDIFIEIHDSIKNADKKIVNYIEKNTTLLYRCNEMAENDGIKKYLLMPLVSYKDIPIVRNERTKGICIGTMAYALPNKRLEDIVDLAKRLDVKAKIVLGINNEAANVEKANAEAIKKIEQLWGNDEDIAISYKGSKSQDKRIKIRIGSFTHKEDEEELKECTHFIFAQKGSLAPSGSMVFVKRLENRPIISLDNFQAKQSQVIRIKLLNDNKQKMIIETTKFYGRNLLQGNRIHLGNYFSEIKDILNAEPLSKRSLIESKRYMPIKDEDGLDYLMAIWRESRG